LVRSCIKAEDESNQMNKPFELGRIDKEDLNI
jgi:hypothetical protein